MDFLCANLFRGPKFGLFTIESAYQINNCGSIFYQVSRLDYVIFSVSRVEWLTQRGEMESYDIMFDPNL